MINKYVNLALSPGHFQFSMLHISPQTTRIPSCSFQCFKLKCATLKQLEMRLQIAALKSNYYIAGRDNIISNLHPYHQPIRLQHLLQL